jgi:hypothetical protein
MLRRSTLLAMVLVPWFAIGAGRSVVAQEEIEEYVEAEAGEQAQQVPPPEYGPPPRNAGETDLVPPPIPPNVEGAAFSVPGGGYCYFGPHPVDTRVSAGEPWDDTPGAHMHAYPPLDLRLFELKDGCYYFVGDPRDFGYVGPTFSYYGAHPILDEYGGGWCFMIGPHAHLWRPWSPNFALVGSWYYWEGGYDPFFWAYWPYYSFYYRTYYPNYYVGGRFHHGGNAVAPPIYRVPPPSHVVASPAVGSSPWRSQPSAHPANGWRGQPSEPRPNMGVAAPSPTYRAAMPAAPAAPFQPSVPAPAMAPARPAAPAPAVAPARPAAPAARSVGGGSSRGSGSRRR